MKKQLCCCIFSFFIVVFHGIEINAQEPISANGKFASIKGIKIYYEDTGKGMPLVLLHGFGRTATDWRSYTSEFAKSNRVIAIDLPGHGRSDPMDTSDIYLHKRAAGYIIEFLESLNLDSVHVMGISSGGFITLYMATIKPQLTKRIVVIGGQVYYSKTTRNVISSLGSPDNMIMKPENMTALHGKQKGVLIAQQFWNFRKL